MLSDFTNYLAAALIFIGSLFALLGAVGLLRFPDVYSRSHAVSMAGTIGSGLVMLAVAVSAEEFHVATRAIVCFLFFILTAPVSAHLLMWAAYLAGTKLWSGATVDHLSNSSESQNSNS